MKIRLRINVPVGREHGLTAGRIMDAELNMRKRNGKCVGYMKVRFSPRMEHLCSVDGTNWWHPEGSFGDGNDEWLECDSIHPIVCQDRNGKDVYEGDWIKATLPNYTRFESAVQIVDGCATVIAAGYWPCVSDCYDIELVEEQTR